MASPGSFQPGIGHTIANDPHGTSRGQDVHTGKPLSVVQPDTEKGGKIEAHAEPEDLKAFPEETPDYDAQRGIQKIEATTLAWGKWSLVALLVKYVTTSILLQGMQLWAIR